MPYELFHMHCLINKKQYGKCIIIIRSGTFSWIQINVRLNWIELIYEWKSLQKAQCRITNIVPHRFTATQANFQFQSTNENKNFIPMQGKKKSLQMFHSHIPPQFVKCGFAGSNFPDHIFPAMVGRPIIRSNTKVGNIEIKVRLLRNEKATGLSLNLAAEVNFQNTMWKFYKLFIFHVLLWIFSIQLAVTVTWDKWQQQREDNKRDEKGIKLSL